MNFLWVRKMFFTGAPIFLSTMIFLYKYWFRIYLRTWANTRAPGVLLTPRTLFRSQKMYFLLSEGSKSLIITFFLFPKLDSIKNISMVKKQPDHVKSRLRLKSRNNFWSQDKKNLPMEFDNSKTKAFTIIKQFFQLFQVGHLSWYVCTPTIPLLKPSKPWKCQNFLF